MNVLELSEERLQPLKELLFGGQKQANVQNDSVVYIVARKLEHHNGEHKFFESIADAVYEMLKDMVDGKCAPDETFIRLVCGGESYRAIMQDGPKTVTNSYPNPESPKCEFRIKLVGAEDTAAGSDVSSKKVFLQQVLKENPRFQEMLKENSNFYPGLSRSEKMKKLIETYPDAFKGYNGDNAEVTQQYADNLANKIKSEAKQNQIDDTKTTGIGMCDTVAESADAIMKAIMATLPNATINAAHSEGAEDWQIALAYAYKYYKVSGRAEGLVNDQTL